ncbi:MAG: hypothetical protein Q9182_001408 [Xanthomendoza sp. 2 TL-2023]
MSDLEFALSAFGMGQYHDELVAAGFDSWETILDITEEDLESLNVQRGHRRRLQQEIARALNLANNLDDQQLKALSRPLAANKSLQSTQTSPKRRYIRKAQPDPHAPQRPLSAYVLFSNAVRDELKNQNLSFAETSKLTGDRWRNLSTEFKQTWKQQASGYWDKYNADMKQYKDTDTYRAHQTYLEHFNSSEPPNKRRFMSNDSPGNLNDSEPKSVPHQAPLSSASHPSVPKRLETVPDRSHQSIAAVSSPTSPLDQRKEPGSIPHTSRSLGSQRFSHACDLCKKKKLKCNGGVRDKDKRLAESLSNTLDVWEDTLQRLKPRMDPDDQNEISKLLLMYHPSEPVIRTSSSGKSHSVVGQSSEDADDTSGGESEASNVGSMGSTDHLDEASFAAKTEDGRIDAFLGQSATDNWVDRLDKNLKVSETDDETGLDYLLVNHNLRPQRSSGNPVRTAGGGLDDPEAGANFFAENIDPYGMPPKASADSFVNAYFTTVHPSFPILSRAHFLGTYEHYYTFGYLNGSSTPSLVLIHLVLAIGAMHTYATQASATREDKYRLLRFAKSKTTILDASVFEASTYEQVQLCGLGGLYLFMVNEINK